MSVTLTMLNERLRLYLTAEKSILESNQSWSSPDGMTYDKAKLFSLQSEIKKIRHEIALLDGTGFQAQTCFFPGRR